MRLFTAIELPEVVRAAVAEAAAPVLGSLPGVRSVAADNLHVTLCFLGDVAEDRLPAIRTALAAAVSPTVASTVASTASAARARVVGFGAFPDARQPRTVWAGVEDPSRSIAAAERAVSAALLPLGFEPEGRPFTAHVTVARIDTKGVAWRRRGPFDTLVLPAPVPLGPEFPVREVVLCRSDLTPRGPRYLALDRFPLAASV